MFGVPTISNGVFLGLSKTIPDASMTNNVASTSLLVWPISTKKNTHQPIKPEPRPKEIVSLSVNRKCDKVEVASNINAPPPREAVTNKAK